MCEDAPLELEGRLRSSDDSYIDSRAVILFFCKIAEPADRRNRCLSLAIATLKLCCNFLLGEDTTVLGDQAVCHLLKV